MASSLVGMQNTEVALKTKMERFPHFTNLDIPVLTQDRLLGLLENLEEEDDSDDICVEETVMKLNFKSWVYVILGYRAKAVKVNDKVVKMTFEKNVMSLGNCVFLRWDAGRQEEAKSCCSKLEEMEKLTDFPERLATAKAELAYAYSRVGGPVNLKKAMGLFEEVISKYPNKCYWNLRLGLVYRRCTHLNIYTGMTGGPSLLECVEKAAKYLDDVCKGTSNNKFRGPALSELAVLHNTTNHLFRNDVQRIFQNRTTKSICDEALQLHEDSTWVLTNCGKLLRNLKQMDRAVEVLKNCLQVKKHTTTHHQLGICYAWMAESKETPDNLRGRGSSRNERGGRGAYPARPRDYRYPTASEPVITLPNENYSKAEEQYLEAINMSHDRNLPAVYDLGLLYKLAGQYQDALNRFNQITNSGGEGHLVTMINAYEQSGLCYKLLNDPEAEDKLMKAINLAVIVAATCPQLNDCATEVWHSFRTMKEMISAEKTSYTRDKKLLKLYELVKNYKEVVKFVNELLALSDSQLEEPEVIIAGLNGYLKQGKIEKAYAFLNMLSMRPDIRNSSSWEASEMVKMRQKVLLLTAENRLQHESTAAKLIFQELFAVQYGECVGRTNEDSVNMSGNRDVLLFYDDEHDTEELSHVSKTVQDLQKVLVQVFGLDTGRNLQACIEYGPKMEVQMTEMTRHHVVIVVLGEEKRTPNFDAMLKVIPHIMSGKTSTKTVLVIDTCQEPAEIPGVLKQYSCLRLQEIIANRVDHGPRETANQDFLTVQEVISNFVGHNPLPLMKLFRFIFDQIL